MRWMWIDRIIAHEPEKRLVSIKNVSLAEEHLHDHFPAGDGHPAQPVMPASLMIEGMAQTAGILVGASRRFTEKVILAKIAKARFDRDVFPGQTLRYEAELDRIDTAGASTHGLVFRLDHSQPNPQWEEIGVINLMFSHADKNLAGLEFPEENFVFSENFRTILRTGGLLHLADTS